MLLSVAFNSRFTLEIILATDAMWPALTLFFLGDFYAHLLNFFSPIVTRRTM